MTEEQVPHPSKIAIWRQLLLVGVCGEDKQEIHQPKTLHGWKAMLFCPCRDAGNTPYSRPTSSSKKHTIWERSEILYKSSPPDSGTYNLPKTKVETGVSSNVSLLTRILTPNTKGQISDLTRATEIWECDKNTEKIPVLSVCCLCYGLAYEIP